MGIMDDDDTGRDNAGGIFGDAGSSGIFGAAEAPRKTVSREEIIRLANEMIKKDWEYMDGMEVTSAMQRDAAIVLRGEFFLDDQGLPTPKTNAVFNMFHRVSVELSRKYRIDENT